MKTNSPSHISLFAYLFIFTLLCFSYSNSYFSNISNPHVLNSDGTPLLVNLDGYYFLAKAKYFDLFSPIISYLIKAIHYFSSISLEIIGYYLPFFLCSAAVLFLCHQFISFFGPIITMAIGIGLFSNLIFRIRSDLGFLDTDTINILVISAISITSYRLFNSEKINVVNKNIFIILIQCIFLSFWWNTTIGIFFILVSFIFSALTLYFKFKICSKKFIFLAAFIFATLAIVFNKSIGIIFNRGVMLLDLVTQSIVNHAQISSSISELNPLSFFSLVDVTGGPAYFILFLSGLTLITIKKKSLLIILAPSLLLSFFSFYSQRFAIFLLFPMAFSTGYLLKEILAALDGKIRYHKTIILVVPILLLIPFWKCSNYISTPRITKYDYQTLSELQSFHGINSCVWTWWDYGYFVEYITGINSFVDGGSQNSNNTFLLSRSLVSSDTIFSYYFMRFISINSNRIHTHNVNELGQIYSCLHNIYHSHDISMECQNYFINFNEKNFYPKGINIFLFLPQSILNTSMWWYHFGNLPEKSIYPKIARFEKKDFKLDAKAGRITKGGEELRFSKLISVGKDKTRTTAYAYPADAVLIDFKNYPAYFVMNNALLRTTAVQLLIRPNDHKGFIPINYVDGGGGLWKVSGL